MTNRVDQEGESQRTGRVTEKARKAIMKNTRVKRKKRTLLWSRTNLRLPVAAAPMSRFLGGFLFRHR